jgi:hypothetical protein
MSEGDALPSEHAPREAQVQRGAVRRVLVRLHGRRRGVEVDVPARALLRAREAHLRQQVVRALLTKPVRRQPEQRPARGTALARGVLFASTALHGAA